MINNTAHCLVARPDDVSILTLHGYDTNLFAVSAIYSVRLVNRVDLFVLTNIRHGASSKLSSNKWHFVTH